MSDVADRLDALIGELTALGSPIGRYMRPGRSEGDVRAALGKLELVPPPALIDWYARHDGTDDDAYERADDQASPLEIFPTVRLVSLDEAVQLALELREGVLDLGEDADAFWRTPWFPVAVGPGSIFAVDCRTAATDEMGVIWRALSHPGPSTTGIVAASLVDLVDAWIRETRDGIVYWHAPTRSIQLREEPDPKRLDAAGLL